MEPAPNPNGIAITKKNIAFPVNAKPNKATTVNIVLTAVTMPVPKRLITFELKRLDIIVQALTVAVIYPARDTGKSNSLYIEGHAVPRIESGNPTPINEINMIINNIVIIIYLRQIQVV